tara:strand:+ start:618 stop:830 length:213 start_codon:yes stop_codon:yes gene_type:complete
MKVTTQTIDGETVHQIEGMILTGAIWDDLERICENGEIESFLFGELETGDILTDGTFEYCGSDIQDYFNN